MFLGEISHEPIPEDKPGSDPMYSYGAIPKQRRAKGKVFPLRFETSFNYSILIILLFYPFFGIRSHKRTTFL